MHFQLFFHRDSNILDTQGQEIPTLNDNESNQIVHEVNFQNLDSNQLQLSYYDDIPIVLV